MWTTFQGYTTDALKPRPFVHMCIYAQVSVLIYTRVYTYTHMCICIEQHIAGKDIALTFSAIKGNF